MKKWLYLLIIFIIFIGFGTLHAVSITDLEGITGKIGSEDVQWVDSTGVPTFSVPTYDGGTVILNKVPSAPWPDVRSYSSPSLATAVASASTANKTIIVLNTQTLTANLIIPSTRGLKIIQGGSIVSNGFTLTINGPFEADHYQVFSGFTSGQVTFGPGTVDKINPIWWGAKTDGTNATATTLAINCALAASVAYTGSPTDLGSIGGIIVHLTKGVYAINSPIIMGTQNTQTFDYILEGDGGWSTFLAWVGGDTNDILQIGRSDGGNMLFGVRVRRICFFNQSTSGVGTHATRARQINGIRIKNPAGGTNAFLIEECQFWFLDNGIICAGAVGSLQELTVRKCLFNSCYNQTNPVVHPDDDALVDGHGNAIYLNNAAHNNLVLSENTVSVQGYFLDVGTFGTVVNLNIEKNEIYSDSFVYHKAIRLSSFTTINIRGNRYQFPNGAAPNIAYNLGTTALGSSNVSGGIFSGNMINGTNSVGQEGIKLTYSDGLSILGNSFFNMGGPGINLVGTNVKNTFIGSNNWITVATLIYDGGSIHTKILDTPSSSLFAEATIVQSTTLGAGAVTFAVRKDIVQLTGNVGTNTIATITGGYMGQILYLAFSDNLVTITDTGTGASETVNLSAPFTSSANDTLTLLYTGAWRELSRSVN